MPVPSGRILQADRDAIHSPPTPTMGPGVGVGRVVLDVGVAESVAATVGSTVASREATALLGEASPAHAAPANTMSRVAVSGDVRRLERMT